MEKYYSNLLMKWSEYVGLDSNHKDFNMSDYSRKLNQETQKAKKIIRDYDESGLVAVLLLKNLYMELLKNKKTSLYDILSGNICLDDEKEMLLAFTSPEIVDVEGSFIHMISRIDEMVTGGKLIGDADSLKESIFGMVDDVIEALDGCNEDIYKKSGMVGEITNISTKIYVAPSLAVLVTTLEKAEDGMYLCYIDTNHSQEGYFGFFVKSNGNIFSVNERIDEAYPGQHQNARWSNAKYETLFPYEYISKYSDYDNKGCSTKYEINSSQLNFAEMPESAYVKILIAMLFISNKYGNKVLDGEEVYMNSLLPQSIAFATNSLVSQNEAVMDILKSEIVKTHDELDLSFEMKSIMDGSVLDEFTNHNVPNGAYIHADNTCQELVDIWGDGFIPDKTLVNGILIKSDVWPEFVGTRQRMKAAACYEIRKQLAQYIEDKIKSEYKACGGINAVREWYKKALLQNFDKIEDMVKSYYPHVLETVGYNRNGRISDENFIVYYEENEKTPTWFIAQNVWREEEVLNDVKKYVPYTNAHIPETYNDAHTNAMCKIWFIFVPNDWHVIESLLGCEVPKIVKGWQMNGHHTGGNSLLNMTDAVEDVNVAFETGNKETPKYSFSFAVGYSKSGLNKLLKN